MLRLSRRDFLKSIGVGATTAAMQPFGMASSYASSETEGNKKPNILFIMVDDLGKEMYTGLSYRNHTPYA